ncbi:MAG: radical SAM protein [Myxococcota bacterium]
MVLGLKNAQLIRSGTACNNACRFCCQGDLSVLDGERSSEDVLADLADVDKRVVVFAGGEVTLRPELPEWVEAAKNAGAQTIVVQTNGRMLSYKKYARQLVKAGVDVFAVGVHGHIAPLHEWLTRIEGSFEQALIGMRNAQSLGAKVYVTTTITRSNFRHLPDMAKLLPAWGAVGIHMSWSHRCTSCPCCDRWSPEELSALIPPVEMVAPYLEQATGIARALKRRASATLPDEQPIEAS